MTRTLQQAVAAIVAVPLTTTSFVTVVSVPEARAPNGVAVPMLA